MTIYVGGYGAGNIGDDLILKSILTQDPSAIVVAYGRPSLSQYQEYIEFDNFIADPERYIRGHADLVIGGGGIFWSSEHIQELLIIALTAKTLGCKLQINRVGLHGFHLNLAASSHLLRLAERISFREHDSLDLARRHLGCDRAVVEPDYAVGVIAPVQRMVKTGKLKVGVNIGSTRFIDDEPFSKHLQQIYAGIAHQFRDELDLYYIPFCSHVSAHNQNDLAKADLLFSTSNGLIQYADFANIDALMEFCTQCDFFIGERFHMHIMANAMKIPFVPFIHNEQTKYRALAREYGDVPTYYESSQAFIMESLTRRIENLIRMAYEPVIEQGAPGGTS